MRPTREPCAEPLGLHGGWHVSSASSCTNSSGRLWRGLARSPKHARSPEHARKTRPAPLRGQSSRGNASRGRMPASLPFYACPALTSTVGIGAASCSGVKFPNSSASTSMLFTTKEGANRTLTRAFAAPGKLLYPWRAVRGGLNSPRRAT